MTKSEKTSKLIITFIISFLIVLLYSRIIRFSLTPAEISGVQSMFLSEKIINVIQDTFSINFNLSKEQFKSFEIFIRKAAHFSEYALLGFLVYSIPLLWNKRTFKPALYSFLAVLIMASIDETVQLFVPGRAGLVSDVIIDGAGCIFGMSVLRLMYNFYVSRKDKK